MKSLFFIIGLVMLSLATPFCHSQPIANQAISVADLKTVPDGNYLVTLELQGQIERLNLLVQGNRLKCVNSSDLKLKSVQGQFQFKDNGLFVASLHGGQFDASQIWIFRADGTAAIREVPDRGEQQSAVPVKGNSIEPPKKK
jgi:hypothetical protein